MSANDVLLGTPQTFYNAIYTNGHVQLSQFSLFVFDECHEYATRGSERQTHPLNMCLTSVRPTMPRATGNSPMARIMKDIYHRAAIKGQSTPHVLGLTASIINGKLLGKEKKREELEVLLQSSVFSPNISEPASGGIEQEVVYVKVDYPQESMQGFEHLVRTKVKQLVTTTIIVSVILLPCDRIFVTMFEKVRGARQSRLGIGPGGRIWDMPEMAGEDIHVTVRAQALMRGFLARRRQAQIDPVRHPRFLPEFAGDIRVFLGQVAGDQLALSR